MFVKKKYAKYVTFAQNIIKNCIDSIERTLTDLLHCLTDGEKRGDAQTGRFLFLTAHIFQSFSQGNS